MSLSPSNRPEFTVIKFESMLKSNNIYYFDASDFEDIINYYLESGKISKAKKAIQMGLEQHPKDVDISVLKVEIMILENKYKRAEVLLLELEILDNSNPEIYIQKASLYSKQNQHKKAILELKKSIDYVDDNIADVYALLGMEYLFLSKYEKAKMFYKKCLEIDREDYASLYNIMYCFDFLKQYDEAIGFLNRYLEERPYCEIAWHQLGMQYLQKNMLREALTCYDFAIISDDTFIGAYLEKGKVLEKMGSYNEAIENYQLTLSIEDPTAFAYTRIGQCFATLGNNSLALLNYEKALEEDPSLDKVWFEMSQTYFKISDYENAFRCIQKAIEIEGDEKKYWSFYDKYSDFLNYSDKAISKIKKKITNEEPILKDCLALVNFQIQVGELKEAIKILKNTMITFPNTADLQYLLAVAYLMKSDSVKGIDILKNALTNNYKSHLIYKNKFPQVFNLEEVKVLIKKLKS